MENSVKEVGFSIIVVIALKVDINLELTWYSRFLFCFPFIILVMQVHRTSLSARKQ